MVPVALANDIHARYSSDCSCDTSHFLKIESRSANLTNQRPTTAPAAAAVSASSNRTRHVASAPRPTAQAIDRHVAWGLGRRRNLMHGGAAYHTA